MATTKAVTVLDNDVTLTAGAGDHTSSVWNLQDGYGGTVDVKLTNGATGPTVPAQVKLQVSEDGSNYYDFVGGGPLVGGVANNGVYSWGGITIPMGAQRLKALSGSNTVQNVTVRIEGSEVTAI